VKNPLTSTHLGGRLLNASQLPLFWLRPPRGYGVLTTIGRKSGKRRRRCVRAPADGDTAYVVAIHGMSTYWARNLDANPEVSLRLRSGTHEGIARRPNDDAEQRRASRIYSEGEIGPFERLEYRLWRNDKPTPEKIRALHREWFERGAPFVIELRRR
jgi:deazaflavin-dependent oxidoreductase (nitroreductase family)